MSIQNNRNDLFLIQIRPEERLSSELIVESTKLIIWEEILKAFSIQAIDGHRTIDRTIVNLMQSIREF